MRTPVPWTISWIPCSGLFRSTGAGALPLPASREVLTWRQGRTHRAVLLAVLAVLLSAWASSGTTPARTGTPAPGAPAAATLGNVSRAERDYLFSRQLMIPVHGVSPQALRDDFLAPRSGGRRHHAIDILAPRLTPVIA